jgi:hypothetical protein
MATKPKLHFWQLSLRTIVLLTIVAGILLGLNLRSRDFTNDAIREIRREIHYGWPADARFVYQITDGGREELSDREERKAAVAFDVGFAFFILLCTAVISEVVLRSGETADVEIAEHQRRVSPAERFYDAMVDPDFAGRDLFIRAVSREVCPGREVFSWIAANSEVGTDRWAHIRGESAAKRDIAVAIICTKLDPGTVDRLEIALNDAKMAPKPDIQEYMDAVEQRIVDARKWEHT